MKEIKINTISLDLAGQKVDLTLEQARELKSVLDELFRDKNAPLVIEKWPTYPSYPNPIWVYDESTAPKYKTWEVLCTSEGGLTVNSSMSQG